MKKNILILSALLGAFLWTGCQTLDEEQSISGREPQTGSFTLSVNAVKGADTKALALVGENTLTPYWDGSEKVRVYKKGDKSIGTLSATPTGTGSYKATATLSGTISGTLAKDDELSLIIFPGTSSLWKYTEQTGAAPGLAAYDYATARVVVDAIENVSGGKQVTTTANATFANEQSVWRFGFKAGGNAIRVNYFSVASSHDKLVQSRMWNDNDWTSTYGILSVTPVSPTDAMLYLAVRNENTNSSENDILSFYVINDEGNALYTGTQTLSGAKLGNGKFLSAPEVSVAKSDLGTQSGYSVSEIW